MKKIFLLLTVCALAGCKQKPDYYIFQAAEHVFKIDSDYFEQEPKTSSEQRISAILNMNIETLEILPSDQRTEPKAPNRLRLLIYKGPHRPLHENLMYWKFFGPKSQENADKYKIMKEFSYQFTNANFDVLLNKDKNLKLDCTIHKLPNPTCRAEYMTPHLGLELHMVFKISDLQKFAENYHQIEPFFESHLFKENQP